jgi:hypothetical protein
VGRWRRPGVNEILLVFLLLAAIGALCSWLPHSPDQNDPLWSFLVSVFLAWRVSRGGRIARMLLILYTGASYAAAALDVARLWNAAVVTLLVVAAAQVALLVSTPVYWHTRKAPVTVRAPSLTQLVRQPPIWLLLPWGLLAGVIVTLAALGHLDFVTISGCRATASDTCTALAEGYPLPWLTAQQSDPLILKDALIRDFVQWALVSTSVLYLLSWSRAAAGSSDPA